MSGEAGEGPPPEVPPEFAEAYRAAYEAALAEQAARAPGVHATRKERRPFEARSARTSGTRKRLVPRASGTRRPLVPRSSGTRETPFEARFARTSGTREAFVPRTSKARERSQWLVPVLLLVLLGLLLVGAYVAGRVFAAHVGS